MSFWQSILSVKPWRPARRVRRVLVFAILATAVVALSGCQTFSFYGQAIKGQYQIFAHEEKIPKLLADSQTPPKLKEKLELLESLRAFAATNLSLPVDGHYQKYVDVHRRFVVWNVEAAPEFSLQPKTWWYPFLGSLEYRGYFSEKGARHYAARLKDKGEDITVGGVEAYSTLGWFKDPVLNTFIFEPEADLAEIIFHELGHQRVFARGDTDFNEAFATTVGQEGARRWLRAQGDMAGLEKYLAELQHTREFARLVQETRTQLEALYGDTLTDEGKVKASRQKSPLPPEEMRRQKECILQQMRQKYARLKAHWGGADDYDAWFAKGINNAKLNSVAAYYDLVPAFEHLLAANGRDLEKFYQAVERLAKEPKKKRKQTLMAQIGGSVKR
jgi:predicted aminopeptidase